MVLVAFLNCDDLHYLLYRIFAWTLAVILISSKCHRASLMTSQVLVWCHQATSHYLSQCCLAGATVPLLRYAPLTWRSGSECQLSLWTIFIRPSLDGTYYGMALSVRPSVRPSVRVYESTCIGYYLCTLNTNWIHFVYWIYPTIQCVEHVYIGYLRVITQNTHLVTDAAHVSVKWPSILCPLYWLHTARFFLWWPVGQSEMVAS